MTLVNEVPQREPRQRHDDPHVNTQMVDGKCHRGVLSLTGHWFIAKRRVKGMVERLGHTPEHQHGASTTGEEHAEPFGDGVFGLFVIIAKLDASVSGHEQADEEDKACRDTTDEQPAHVRRNPIGSGRVGIPSGIPQRYGHCHKEDNETHRCRENQRVGRQVLEKTARLLFLRFYLWRLCRSHYRGQRLSLLDCLSQKRQLGRHIPPKSVIYVTKGSPVILNN